MKSGADCLGSLLADGYNPLLGGPLHATSGLFSVAPSPWLVGSDRVVSSISPAPLLTGTVLTSLWRPHFLEPSVS